jgi:hypothetical protein
MLKKVLKVIGIGMVGGVIALGGLAASVVYVIPAIFLDQTEKKVALSSVPCPPGMIEDMVSGQCSASAESMTKVAVAIAQIEDAIEQKIDRDPAFLRGLAHDTREDGPLAFKLFHLAAVMGDAESQYILGAMLSNGEGTKEDDHESLQWLHEAAHNGFRKAQLRLAYMLSSGEFLMKNEAEAVKWLKRAEENKEPTQLANTGV